MVVVFVTQEQQRHEFETERDENLHQNAMEKEELLNRFDREREDLQEELANLQRERDNQLLMAENDKQQVTTCWCIQSCYVFSVSACYERKKISVTDLWFLTGDAFIT